MTNERRVEDRAFAGAAYLLPYLVEGRATLDSEGDVRVGLAKDFQLSDALKLDLAFEYDTETDGEFTAGEFRAWCDANNIEIIKTTSYTPVMVKWRE